MGKRPLPFRAFEVPSETRNKRSGGKEHVTKRVTAAPSEVVVLTDTHDVPRFSRG